MFHVFIFFSFCPEMFRFLINNSRFKYLSCFHSLFQPVISRRTLRLNGSSLRLDAVSSSVSAVRRRSGRRPLQAVALRRGNLLLLHPLLHGESAAQTRPDLRSRLLNSSVTPPPPPLLLLRPRLCLLLPAVSLCVSAAPHLPASISRPRMQRGHRRALRSAVCVVT